MPALALLGRPFLIADGHHVVTGRAAQRHCLALLTLLAGERRGLSRDRTIAYLWPECDAPSARHRLSVTLHVLHEQLGRESIAAISDGLALEPTCWDVDAWQFEDAAVRGSSRWLSAPTAGRCSMGSTCVARRASSAGSSAGATGSRGCTWPSSRTGGQRGAQR